MNFKKKLRNAEIICAIFTAFVFHGCKTPQTNVYDADIIVYGGTSAAVIAAVEVSRSGKTVIIVSPDKHLGGLTSGGLGYTDIGKIETVGGLSLEFYNRIYKYYDDSTAWKWQSKNSFAKKGILTGINNKPLMWLFEPHVAGQVFEDYIAGNHIVVFGGMGDIQSARGVQVTGGGRFGV